MEIIRGYKTELDLNNRQRTMCLQHAGCARFVYNWGLARKKEALDARKVATDPQSIKIPSAIDLQKELVILKRSNYPWLTEISKWAPERALRHLDDAFVNWFANRGKFPHFKKRSKSIGSFTLCAPIYVGADWIQLPRMGKLRVFEHGYLPQNKHILSATVSEHAGHWFVSLLIREKAPDPIPATSDPVGIDLGIKEMAVCSDAVTIPNPKALRGRLKALKRAQQGLSRKKPGSKNRQKAKAKVAKLHYKVSCIREDTLQKATTQIVAKTKPVCERPQAIILEDLNVAGMLKNHSLAQAIADVGLGKFKQYLAYKSHWYGNELYLANRFYPSTQLCSGCHRLPSVKLDLSVRTYHCEHCGLTLDRDLNAALNLVWLYTASAAEIDACGEILSPRVLVLAAVSLKQEPSASQACLG